MNTYPATDLPIKGAGFSNAEASGPFCSFPTLSSSPTPEGCDGDKIKHEDQEDEGNEGIPSHVATLSVNPDMPDSKRKRATAAASVVKNTAPKKPKKTPKFADYSDTETPPGAKKTKWQKVKKEPGEGVKATWTGEELELVRTLCEENKTGRQIFLELQNKLGSTKNLVAVKNCRVKVKQALVSCKWSDEDTESLRQVVKNFDKYKAITAEFNRIAREAGRAGSFGKGDIELKLKSLAMDMEFK